MYKCEAHVSYLAVGVVLTDSYAYVYINNIDASTKLVYSTFCQVVIHIASLLGQAWVE